MRWWKMVEGRCVSALESEFPVTDDDVPFPPPTWQLWDEDPQQLTWSIYKIIGDSVWIMYPDGEGSDSILITNPSDLIDLQYKVSVIALARLLDARTVTDLVAHVEDGLPAARHNRDIIADAVRRTAAARKVSK